MTQEEIDKEEIRRYGTTDQIDLLSIYEDCLGLFIYEEDVIVGHRKRFIEIIDKTKNSIEYREYHGRKFRSWIELFYWNKKVKSAEAEMDFNRGFINSSVRKSIMRKVDSEIMKNNGVRYVKVNAGVVELADT